MKRSTAVTVWAVAAGFMLLLGGCCKSNETKTKSCKHTKTSEECKTCCGGNYSFVGSTPDSCTCY